jgi:dTDP-4-amino-4,6-dideoxygalactose transaminase
VLRVKLRHLDAWNGRRRAVVDVYRERLAGVAGLEVFDALPDTVPSWHLFVVRHRERDAFRARLADAGVETVIHYPTPPHAQGAYRDGFAGRAFPVAEAQAREVLSLPMGPHLSLEHARLVADAVLACR